MLQAMRHLAQTVVVKGLLLILAVSFAIWGVGDIFRGNTLREAVAKVGRKSISVQQLEQEFSRGLSGLRSQLGQEITADQAKKFGLLDSALSSLIQKSLLDQDSERMGIQLSAQAALNQYAEQPMFRNKDGSFDQAKFDHLLDRLQVSKVDLANELAHKQIMGFFDPAPPLPSSVSSLLTEAMSQEHLIDVIKFDNKGVTIDHTLKDEDVQTYYNTHKDRFISPEYRSMSILTLVTDDLAKSLAINTSDIEKEYKEHPEHYGKPERRDLLQVVLQDEAKATTLAADARVSHDLAASAKKLGFEAVPLQDMDKASLFEELSTPVFALPLKAISEPLKSTMGYHVIEVTKISEGTTPPLAQIKDKIINDLQHNRAIDQATSIVNKVDDELAAGHSLEDIAAELKLTLTKVVSLDKSGKPKDPPSAPTFTDRDLILSTAFTQGSGDTSPILDNKKGTYYVVRTDEIMPSQTLSYEDAKTKVAEEIRAQKQKEAAEKLAKDMVERLQKGESVEAVLALYPSKEGIHHALAKPLDRLGHSDEQIPASLNSEVFALKKNEVMTTSLAASQVILKCIDLKSIEGDNKSSASKKVESEIDDNRSKELLDEYTNYLKSVYPIRINREAFQMVMTQGGL